ncbi:hypothetical protein [Bacillus sp. 2205SS5-2]|uniref:hypothetical protein n=1 Tax=Bacillus sp. 2205SS5-2 TaxID=3109031 RepID=UPI0030067B76
MNRFKLYHPKFMVFFYCVLFFFFGIIDLTIRNPNFAIITVGEYKIQLFSIIIILGLISFSVFLIIYFFYFQKWNKGNPFTLKPPEINEEDEGSQEIYYTAAKRIYMFYTAVIPILMSITFFLYIISFQIETYMIIHVLLMILLIHYLIYYKVILEYIN